MKAEEIGLVHSCFKAKFGTPRQSQVAKSTKAYIQIHKKWEPLKSLKGLEGFSHAWVLFYFHENKNSLYRPIVRPPRLGRKGVGVFATRSPVRPNPIGLSLVAIEKVEGDKVYISGVDIIDGTPVLDIKPYIHEYDSVRKSLNGWLSSVEEVVYKVEFTTQALKDLETLKKSYLKQSLSEILKHDVRSRNDKSLKNEGRNLGFFYEDLNVHFRYEEDLVTVLSVETVVLKKGRSLE